MKILIFDHLTINEAYLVPYKLLVEKHEHELLIVRPDHWFEYNQKIQLDDISINDKLNIVSSRIFFPNKFNRLVYRFSLKKIKDFNPDIIYSNSEPENFSSLHFSLLKIFFLKKPRLVFVSWRNIDHSISNHPYKFGFIYNFIEKISLSCVTTIVGFNQEAVRIFKQKSFSNIFHIPMGIDMKMFKYEKKSLKKKSKSFNIGFIGRFEQPKGVQLLIKALPLLSGKFNITLVGDGPCKEWYLELAKELNVLENIVLRNGVIHTDIPAILNSFDVLVLPSLTDKKWIEQFGRVLVEAMASGIPVIGSSSGEIPKVIADAGLIFEEGNIDQLAACLQKMYDEPELKVQLREKGIKRVKETYSWEVLVQKWDELFKETVSR